MLGLLLASCQITAVFRLLLTWDGLHSSWPFPGMDHSHGMVECSSSLKAMVASIKAHYSVIWLWCKQYHVPLA